mgnify:CR=1 FL=1
MSFLNEGPSVFRRSLNVSAVLFRVLLLGGAFRPLGFGLAFCAKEVVVGLEEKGS